MLPVLSFLFARVVIELLASFNCILDTILEALAVFREAIRNVSPRT